jgi:tetratricopeptide (TPR) repeat protein
MTDQSTIQYISEGLANSAAGPGHSRTEELVRAYPYFVPGRYLAAAESFKKTAMSPELLGGMRPYTGNWLLFCDFLQKSNGVAATAEVMEEVADEAAAEEIFITISETEPEIVEEMKPVIEADELKKETAAEPLILPVYTEDYFLQQGLKISEEIPQDVEELKDTAEEDKSLMVMMSFSEWLMHFRNTSQKQMDEQKDQKALKTMWQKEKLAAAMEEENEEIPENVFEMAVNSISKEEGLASESLAEIYMKQGKYDRAIDMYKKLSLRNPKKSAYFARKIEEVLKEKQS